MGLQSVSAWPRPIRRPGQPWDTSALALLTVLFGLALALYVRTLAPGLLAEVYAPNAAFLTGLVWLLLRWQRTEEAGYLWAFALLYPLTGAVHASTALAAPGFLLFVFLHPRWLWVHRPQALIAIAHLLGGALILLGLFFWMDWLPRRPDWVHSALITAPDSFGLVPSDLDSFFERLGFVAGGRQFHGAMFSQSKYMVKRNLDAYWDRLPREFAGPALRLAVLGAAALLIANLRAAVALALVFVGNLYFDVNYDINDIWVFFIPTYAIVALAIGAGLSGIEAVCGWGAERLGRHGPHWAALAVRVAVVALVAAPLFLKIAYIPFREGRW